MATAATGCELPTSVPQAPGDPWFVVHTHRLKERSVELRLHQLGHSTFLPQVERRQAGAKVKRLVPLFPGYLFVQIGAQAALAGVRWLPGIKRLLGDQSQPRPIASEIVTAIRARADATGLVRLHRRLTRGCLVEVAAGPLAGFTGLLDGTIDRPEQRVAVLLELFGRGMRVEFQADELVAADLMRNRRIGR